MSDIFTQVRNLLVSDAYFADFKIPDGDEIKIYDEDDAPTAEHAPLLTIEIIPGTKDRNTDWTRPQVIFHAIGPNEEDEATGYRGKPTLYEICENAERIVRSAGRLAATAYELARPYEVMGATQWDIGKDPVIEMTTVSAALFLGIAT